MCLSLKDPSPPCSSSPSLRNHYFSEQLVSPNYVFSQIKILEENSLIECEVVPVGQWKDCGMRMPLYNWIFKQKTTLWLKKEGGQQMWLVITDWGIS